ncbi:MAG: AraC family transcriptional regulator [Cyanobacteria bacterium J06642_11]
MKSISLSFNDIQQIAKDFQQTYGGNYQLASHETILIMPAMVGQGYLRGIKLRDGLDLFIYEYELNDDLSLDFQQLAIEDSFIKLSFCISGYCRGSSPGFKRKVEMSSWQTVLATVPNAAGGVEFSSKQKISVIELVMTSTFLTTLIAGKLKAMPSDWQAALKANAAIPLYSLTSTSQAISHILQSILNCPYQDTFRQLYLESKSLELMALYLSDLTDSSCNSTDALQQKELDGLHQAKSILLSALNDPPCLTTLAKQVGLSERKLQQGFQELFGTTVFGVLHDCRMEQAKQLLESKQMTVGAIANTVGIAHRGYFASAFKRKFGSTPSEYLKRFKA